MTLRRSFRVVAMLSAAAMLALGGCAKKGAAAEGTMAPADTVAATPTLEAADGLGLGPDDLDALQAELGEVESELLAAGVSLPSAAQREPAGELEEQPEPSYDETDTGVANRCTRICDLAKNACNLQERICDLAERHAGEPRYAQVCERAEADCTRASTACDDCS